MRDKILEAAEQMVQERGLNAVSFQQLADAVGLSKPSVFHHFKTKEELAQALIGRCQSMAAEHYDCVIQGDLPAPEKLERLAALFEKTLRADQSCLLRSLEDSAETLPDSAREELRLTITATIDRFARIFEQGRRESSLRFEGSPTDAAAGFLALLQGLQVLARAQKRPDTFAAAMKSHLAGLAA